MFVPVVASPQIIGAGLGYSVLDKPLSADFGICLFAVTIAFSGIVAFCVWVDLSWLERVNYIEPDLIRSEWVTALQE